MKFDPKWLKVMGLALSFPSLIFSSAFAAYKLTELGIMTKGWAFFVFLLVTSNTLFLLVRYTSKKNKD